MGEEEIFKKRTSAIPRYRRGFLVFPIISFLPSVLDKSHLWGYCGLLPAASQLEHSHRGFLALNLITPLIVQLSELILLSLHPPQ